MRLPACPGAAAGRMESADVAQARGAVDLAIIGVMAYGGLRRSEAVALTWSDVEFWPDGTARITIRRSKNQPETATVAGSETTARALREIEPDGANPSASVLALTGETLVNLVCDAVWAAGRRGPAAGAMEALSYGGPLH